MPDLEDQHVRIHNPEQQKILTQECFEIDPCQSKIKDPIHPPGAIQKTLDMRKSGPRPLEKVEKAKS